MDIVDKDTRRNLVDQVEDILNTSLKSVLAGPAAVDLSKLQRS